MALSLAHCRGLLAAQVAGTGDDFKGISLGPVKIVDLPMNNGVFP